MVSDEGKIGRGHLDRFMELETLVPTLVTTSQMLTTGVDVPTCKNVVLARVINSMTDFKQIIGRGTRVRDDYGKYFFSILDYTGSATRLFADPDFDGDPALITEEEMNDAGEPVGEPEVVGAVREPPPDDVSSDQSDETAETPPRKFYVDHGSVEIAAHLVYELDADGKATPRGEVHGLHRRKGAQHVPFRRRAALQMVERRRARHNFGSAGRTGHFAGRTHGRCQAAGRRSF